MNPEWKMKWLRALRSGKYKQTEGALNKGNQRMCCLGVLCDIVDPKGWTKTSDGFRHHGKYSFPPSSVSLKVGLTRDDELELAEVNDEREPNAYRSVIRYIEKNL